VNVLPALLELDGEQTQHLTRRNSTALLDRQNSASGASLHPKSPSAAAGAAKCDEVFDDFRPLSSSDAIFPRK
jgi:hypothetical protein